MEAFGRTVKDVGGGTKSKGRLHARRSLPFPLLVKIVLIVTILV